MKPRLLDYPWGQVSIDEGDWLIVQPLTLYLGQNGYVYYSRWIRGKSWPTTLHSRLVTAPRGSHIDHINGNKLDNRQSNLRVVSPQINQVNRKRLNRNNTSGVRGVQYRPQLSSVRPWYVQITVDRKNIYLGVFATRDEAVAARKAAELAYYGELCP